MSTLPGGVNRTDRNENINVLHHPPAYDYLTGTESSASPLWEREILDRLVENLFGAPTFLTDTNGTITSYNPAMREMLGYSSSDTAGCFSSGFLPGGKDAMRRLLYKVAESGQPLDNTILVRAKDGTSLKCKVAAKFVKDRNGRTAGIVGTLSDVTNDKNVMHDLRDEAGAVISRPEDSAEHKRSKDDEFHARRLEFIGRMATQIAHEVKNPVASIRLNIEMIESELEQIPNEESRKEASELLGSVMLELDRLERITGACLQYVQIPQLRLRKYSLHRMLKELQDFMKREMETRKISFANELADDIPNIHFDKDRMKEAILNLYKNAADAMPDGGKIGTSTIVANECIEIRISDTGSGIPEVDPAKLFEPFFTNKSLGTGLGLVITRDIITAHGGTVEFDSKKDEETTFLLRLPIRR